VKVLLTKLLHPMKTNKCEVGMLCADKQPCANAIQ